jgi:capsular exopolysaccharide synthesis family protein
MSRIQEILKKAERDGAVRRTHGPLVTDGPSFAASAAIAPAIPLHAPVAEPPAGVQAHDSDAEEHRAVGARLDYRLVAALGPRSLAAEQYRSLRTRIHHVENGRALRALIVTSPGKGDGKSLTAANLALTMAQEFQQRVLLVDADLRRPSTHLLFGVHESPGLADALMGSATLESALVSIPDYHLTLLPAGMPPARPAELLGSAAMRRTLDVLRTRFDRVILDMPPVEPLADVHIVAPMADGLLMIVRAGQTAKPAIDRALAGLDRSKVLGLVLNEAGGESRPDAYDVGYGYIAG